MPLKPLAGIAAGVMLVAMMAPMSASALVPQTILVEETGWML